MLTVKLIFLALAATLLTASLAGATDIPLGSTIELRPETQTYAGDGAFLPGYYKLMGAQVRDDGAIELKLKLFFTPKDLADLTGAMTPPLEVKLLVPATEDLSHVLGKPATTLRQKFFARISKAGVAGARTVPLGETVELGRKMDYAVISGELPEISYYTVKGASLNDDGSVTVELASIYTSADIKSFPDLADLMNLGEASLHPVIVVQKGQVLSAVSVPSGRSLPKTQGN